MCYHYSLTNFALQSSNRFSAMQEDYKIIEEYDELYHINGFNFPKVPVIASDNPHKFQLFNWGFIPSWTKSDEDAKSIRTRTLNARSEEMYEKPSYRSACKAGRRCLIPADGIFEWQAVNKKKYPYYIGLKDREIFCMAGIWEEWTSKDSSEQFKTFSLVTTEANPLMARIHNDGQRMPIILPREIEMEWLNENLSKEDVLAMAVPYPEDMMSAYTISKLITTRGVNTNVPEIREKVEYPELSQQSSLF